MTQILALDILKPISLARHRAGDLTTAAGGKVAWRSAQTNWF